MDGKRLGGGILSLLAAINDDPSFAQAVEYDLLALGYRLRWVGDGVHDLSWWDVYTVVCQAPRHSAVVRSLSPDSHEWGLAEHLQAATVDTLAGISWQLSSGKGERPRQIPRPGVDGYVSPHAAQREVVKEEPRLTAADDVLFADSDASGTFTGVAVGLDELTDWLGWDQRDDEPVVASGGRDDRIAAAYAAGGVTYAELAEQYGLSPSTIGRIVRAHACG